MITRVKGTQDFLDLTLFQFIIDQFKHHVSLYNHTHIETPIIEPVELFIRSLGQHTDVVSKEMFLLDAKGKDDRFCLRPEGTAPTMRAFLEAHPTTPWKVFSYGPMFRYERPQKGRFRQFHQINIEVIGSKSITQDALLLIMLDRFFTESLRMSDYALHINFLGSYEDRHRYHELLTAFLKQYEEICDTCKVRRDANPLRVFDCKNAVCQSVYSMAPSVLDSLSAESLQEWNQLQKDLSLASVTYAVNPRLVRGLDYYNKTVFEFVSGALGAQNAFCGGGRYDKLAQELGSREPYPSLGAAIGIERLLLVLEPIKDQLSLTYPPACAAIIPLSEKQRTLALLIADELHAANIACDILLEDSSLKSMMRHAHKMAATWALLIGDEEQDQKTVLVKHMVSGVQEHVPQRQIASYLKNR